MGNKKWRNRERKSNTKELETQHEPQRYESIFYHTIITLLILLSYGNSLDNAFVSDDIFAIANNPSIGSWQNVSSQVFKFFQPLVYFILYHVDASNPTVFRLVNILAHIGVANFIFILVRRLINPIAAFIAAAIFAVHPILIESVSWISGGVYSWYTFFFLVSFYFYVVRDSKSWKYYLSIFFFWMSLVVGVPAISLSGIFFVYEISYGNLTRRWIRIIPYFILSGIYAIFTLRGFGSRVESLTVTNNAAPQFINPLLQVPLAVSEYLRLFIWPDTLTLYQSELSITPWGFPVRVLVLVVICATLCFGFFKNKHLFFGLSIFIIGLLPTLTPISLAWIVAERYVYFSIIGLVYLFGYGSALLIRKYSVSVYIILCVIIVALSIRTIVRNYDWHNEDNLWIATARVSPSDPKSHNNMGDVYARNGDLENAAKSFETALVINPNYPDATHNLANIYRMQGKHAEAFELYKRAVQLNPNIWQSHLNLAALYFEAKEYDTALEHGLKADSIYPSDPQIKTNLGIIYQTMGDLDSALAYYQAALALDPTSNLAQQGIASLKNTQ